MERKRSASQRVSTIVEAKQEAPKKLSKLVLSVPQPPKRAKYKSTTVLEDCVQAETADDLLKQLLLINESHLPSLVAEWEKTVGTIQDLWRANQSNAPICCVLVRLLAELVVCSEALSPAVREVILSLVEHESTDVVVTALKAYQKIISHFTQQVALHGEVLSLAQRVVHNGYHGVRVECLNLIGQLGHMTSDTESPLAMLEEYSNDSDPRVRSAAFHALVQLHKRGFQLPLSVYYKASRALSDDSEDVRLMAVQLVWCLGLEHPDSMTSLKQDSSVEMRLLDDAFVKICDLLNDVAMRVRALAAGMLGDFPHVSVKFLEQTLDKKLMSHLRVVKSDHQRQRELHAGATAMDWDSGKSWGSGVPKLELDPSEISLMSAGACGAFVHSLEDEFMEVRSAAVDSMCRLSMKSKRFATLSLDFLVDMFNDEIQSIRLKAINALRCISVNIELREDQLETVLGGLEESSTEIREALHTLLSSSRVPSTAGLNSTIHALLDNLKKYSSDRQSIWRCLKQLGASHSPLVSALVPELLSTHPFFMSKEPDVEDPAYVCILILVFNAASCCPAIPSLFPNHLFRHYSYLRDTLPHLIPHIRMGTPAIRLGMSHRRRSGARGSDGGIVFLNRVLSRAQTTCSLPKATAAMEVWSMCISDLQRIAELDTAVAGPAHCAATFLQCQLHMSKVSEVLSRDLLVLSSRPQQQNLSHTLTSIRELFLLSYRLEHTFSGLPPKLLLRVGLIRAAAHAMLLLLSVQLDIDTEQSDEYTRLKWSFMERLQKIKSSFPGVPFPIPVSPLLDMDIQTVAMETLTQTLQPLVTGQVCVDISANDLSAVCQSRADITEPQELSREDFTKFVASLALSVDVKAALSHVQHPERIAVQAKFPDGRKLVFSPKAQDIRETSLEEASLDMSVVISHGVWTDPCPVELCVVTRYSPDPQEDECLSLLSALQRSTDTAPSHLHSPRSQLAKAVPPPLHPPLSSLSVCSHSNDSCGEECSVLAISDVAMVTVHPLENASRSYNVFHPL